MIRRSGYHGGIDSQTWMPWMSNFRPFDRETGFLLPPSLDGWLPELHLARFVVEVIGSLDLSAMARSYRGTGSASYHPELLLGVLVYGYTTGVFSSRKLERGPRQDRGARQRALRAGDGRASRQACGAAGASRGDRQKAWRQTARAAGRGTAAQGPDQPDRRGLADHAGRGRRV